MERSNDRIGRSIGSHSPVSSINPDKIAGRMGVGVSRKGYGKMNLANMASPMGDVMSTTEEKHPVRVDSPKYQRQQREAYLLNSVNRNQSPRGDESSIPDFQIKITHEAAWQNGLRK